MEFRQYGIQVLLAFAAPWRGRVMGGAFIVSHNISRVFSGQPGSPVACTHEYRRKGERGLKSRGC